MSNGLDEPPGAEPFRAGAADADESNPAARRYVSAVWTLLAALAVIVMVLLLYGHFSSDATSTVNPQKMAAPQ